MVQVPHTELSMKKLIAPAPTVHRGLHKDNLGFIVESRDHDSDAFPHPTTAGTCLFVGWPKTIVIQSIPSWYSTSAGTFSFSQRHADSKY